MARTASSSAADSLPPGARSVTPSPPGLEVAPPAAAAWWGAARLGDGGSVEVKDGRVVFDVEEGRDLAQNALGIAHQGLVTHVEPLADGSRGPRRRDGPLIQRPDFGGGQDVGGAERGFEIVGAGVPAVPGDDHELGVGEVLQDLIHKEDSLLDIYVKSKNETFKRSEIGFWYKINDSGNGNGIENKAACNFTYKLLFLDGKVIENGRKSVVIGKKQLVTGLEEGLKLLHKGDIATFIIPWYLGYGMKGNEHIPPYTSLRYEVRIDN
jgi:hypothetical protein